MKSITVQTIRLHTIALPFVELRMTSFGNDRVKATVLVGLTTTEGVTGWGEITLEVAPGYAAAMPVTSRHIVDNFVIPRQIGKTFTSWT